MATLAGVLGGLGKGVRYLGIALVALGLLAMLAPVASGATVVLIVGFVLLLAGLVLSAFGYQAWSASKGPYGLVAGGLGVLCGLALVLNPVSSLSAATSLVAIYLVAQGVSELLLGFRLMPEDGWAWVVADAIVSIVLGAAIWSEWPLSGPRAMGVLVGVKLVSAGAVLVRVEKTMHRLHERAATLHARLADRLGG